MMHQLVLTIGTNHLSSRKKKRGKKDALKEFEEELDSVRSTFNDEEELRYDKLESRATSLQVLFIME